MRGRFENREVGRQGVDAERDETRREVVEVGDKDEDGEKAWSRRRETSLWRARGVYSQVRRTIGPLDGARRLAPTACDSGRSVNISDSLPPTDLFSASTTCTCGPVHATYARGWEYSRIYAVHPEPHLCESSLHK